jgi:hypothetical protein
MCRTLIDELVIAKGNWLIESFGAVPNEMPEGSTEIEAAGVSPKQATHKYLK